MKWSFIIQQKIKAALLLSGVMVFIILNSLMSRSSMNTIDRSFSSIYQDRLVPAIDIVYLSEHLYTKRLLLEKELSNKEPKDVPVLIRQLHGHDQKIDSLIAEFEQTILIEEEVKSLAAFKKNMQAYSVLEKQVLSLGVNSSFDAGRELFYTQGALVFQKSIHQLSKLTKIQSVVGKELMKDSHTEAHYINLLFTLQIVIAIVIALLILGLIHSSKIIKQDSAPFHLN
jgi:Four helix bundle sensory module for signal transduction